MDLPITRIADFGLALALALSLLAAVLAVQAGRGHDLRRLTAARNAALAGRFWSVSPFWC